LEAKINISFYDEMDMEIVFNKQQYFENNNAGEWLKERLKHYSNENLIFICSSNC